MLDTDSGWLWKDGKSVRLTIRERMTLRQLLNGELDYRNPDDNAYYYIHCLRMKGLSIKTLHGWECTDEIELVGDTKWVGQ